MAAPRGTLSPTISETMKVEFVSYHSGAKRLHYAHTRPSQSTHTLDPHNKTEVGRRLAFEILSKVFNISNLPRIPAATAAYFTPRVGRTSIAFQQSSIDWGLHWGGTHNCTVCCTNETAAIEICYSSANNTDCADQSSGWRPAKSEWQGGILVLLGLKDAPTGLFVCFAPCRLARPMDI